MGKSNIIAENFFLSQYDSSEYDKHSVSIDTLIMSITDKHSNNYRKLPEKELSVLLVKRNEHPHKNKWALPGRFLSLDESIEKAAYRQITDVVETENIYLEQLFTWGDVDRDRRTRVLSCSYMALINNSEINSESNEDVEETQWFSLKISTLKETRTDFYNGYHLQKQVLIELIGEDEILTSKVLITYKNRNSLVEIERYIETSEGIAFDHGKIILYGIERLRAKIEYTDIAFHFMMSEFTFTELQSVYEVILGRKLLTANFRRKIAKYVEETQNISQHAGHRPAKLYKFKQIENYDFY